MKIISWQINGFDSIEADRISSRVDRGDELPLLFSQSHLLVKVEALDIGTCIPFEIESWR
jgi:hypothetical protein